MPRPPIEMRGVRVHNLKNIDLDIPSNRLVLFCGVSGSGKSSLAMDTLYAEGQRRYIESFSAYTRQFLQRLDKPDYDRIDNLPPALSVTRQAASRSNRSTIGTASETNDYLRLLFAKVGQLFCFGCGEKIVEHSPETICQWLANTPGDARIIVAFSFHWEDREDLSHQLADFQQAGLVRVVVGNRLFNLARDDREELSKAFAEQGNALVAVDRIQGSTPSARTVESIEQAFQFGNESMLLLVSAPELAGSDIAANSDGAANSVWKIDDTFYRGITFSKSLRCHSCQIDYPSPQPTLFSFNSPLGACPKCEGFGDTVDLDMELIVPDQNKTIEEGAIATWNSPSYQHELGSLIAFAKKEKIPVDRPWRELTLQQKQLIEHGSSKREYGGIRGFFQALERKKYKLHVRVFLSRWRSYSQCSECHGKRLQPQALAFRIAGKNFSEISSMEIEEAISFFDSICLDERDSKIAANVMEQVKLRFRYLRTVGLGYLTLDRTLRTLSGGEIQRVSLTTALGSSLVNMLYVLDEPTVGLHPHDTDQLVHAIEGLRDRGNTVVVVEHEEEMLLKADWLIEIGPTAGEQGGRVVFQGTLDEMKKEGASLTGEYIAGRRGFNLPTSRRKTNRGSIKLCGASGNNLKKIDVDFPLGVLCVVTGVSGSGKSSLVQDTLYGAICKRKKVAVDEVLPYDNLIGEGQIDEVILVDQSPISRSPRSNPVTFIKAFDEIRNAFAGTLEAKTRNLTPSHFSFNHDLGRCQTCQGDGQLEIDMQFLADVSMKCQACQGKRYRQEILQIKYRDVNIADVLEMTARQAIHFFRGETKLQQKLQVLLDVGLGYLQLGQSATTISAGEAQRLKLASFLASASKRRTLFLLDEPTTGLHYQDIVQLLDCFDALLNAGHSLIVVEHNMQLILAADYLIDIGPGASRAGGRVVATGTPEEVASNSASITGKYLKSLLDRQHEVVG